MPTANSTQIKIKIRRRAAHIAIRYVFFRTLWITSSQRNPVPPSKTPAAMKSKKVQFTSFVNCIAIKGMSNKITEMINIKKRVLIFMFVLNWIMMNSNVGKIFYYFIFGNCFHNSCLTEHCTSPDSCIHYVLSLKT